MASEPDNFETLFSPGGEPSGPTKPGPDKGSDRNSKRPNQDPPKSDRTQSEQPANDLSESDWGQPTEWGKSTLGEGSGVPEPPPQIGAVGEKLIQLQIINKEQWEAAIARASKIDELRGILDSLQSIPSHRRTRGEPQIPALTEFQAKMVLAGNAKRLRLGPYLILDRLGAGGMGEVFRGWNLDLDRIEAIKTITSDEVTGSTMGLARFDREARVLAQLAHPCITTIYSTGREDGVAYIAMQYIRGRTLVQVVKDANAKGEDVPVEWAIDAMREVASALEHAHSSGVIHRDIKPNNIMITSDGEVRVLDMGIARLVDPSARNAPGLTRHVAGMGTPEVMPPEQWADASSVSPASDIYSLGCTFFYLLAGRMPFVGNDMHTLMTAHLTKSAPDICDLRSDVPRPISDILAKMLEKEAADRFASCTELIAAIDECKATQQSTMETPARGHWVWISAAVVLAAMVAGFGWYIGARHDYNRDAQLWLADWQKLTSDQWESIDDLKAAVDSSPYKEVNSAAGLAGLKQWVTDQTAERKKEGDFEDFLSDYRNLHASVWPSSEALDQFVSPLRPTLTYDQIRDRVREETMQRESLRSQGSQQIAQALATSPEIWESAEQIEQAANAAVPIDAIFSPDHINQREKAILDAAASRWTSRIEKSLTEHQLANQDVWKSPNLIVDWAKDQTPFESITTSKEYHRLLDLVRRETTARASLIWALQYRTEHPIPWKGDDDLIAFVQRKFPDGVESDETLQAMQAAVRQETVARMQTIVDQWAKDFTSVNPDVWPQAKALVQAVYPSADWESLAASANKSEFEDRAKDVSYKRVFQAPLVKTNDPLKDYLRLETIRLLELFLGIHNSDIPPTTEVKVAAEIGGKPVDRVPLNADAMITVKASKPGYVTLIVLGSKDEVFMIHWEEPIKAGQTRGLIPISATTPGTERIIVYVTNTSPWQLLPKPPPDLGISPKDVLKDQKYLQQMIYPAVQLYPPEENEPGRQTDDLDPIRKSLPTKDLLNGLKNDLYEGKAPDYVPPAVRIKEWGRDAIQIDSGNP